MVSPSSRRGATMPSISATLLLLAQAVLPAAAQCDTYTTTGPEGTTNHTFMNYAFYDWRSLGDQLSGTPVYSQNVDFNNGQFALSTSPYFNSSTWTSHWSNMNYKQAANRNLSQYVDMVYTPLNVAIAKDNSTTPDGDTLLSLTTTRLENYSASAYIQSIQKYMHASIRMSARMLGPPGACGAFYLYGDDQNESDIELLTNDTSSLFHATNHPSQNSQGESIPGATTAANIPQNGTANNTALSTWSDWTDWRMDWTAESTQWIVNGVLVVDKTYHPPAIPAFIGVNMWSNGGSWTGNMTVGQSATLQIRWIEVVYNTTSDKTPSGSNTCLVRGNNDAANAQAISANPTSWAVPRFSSSPLAWTAILGTALWSIL